MASSSAPTPDTLVTLKVNIEGANRRFKLPLRDLGASTLPEKLRFLLAIPPSAEVIFERYSDSAAAFVTLDANNAAVYKQLYRAAKAKLKLRLKVTVKDKEEKEPVMSHQATVEDEDTTVGEEKLEAGPATLATPVAQETTTENEPKTTTPSVADIQRGFENLLLNRADSIARSTTTTTSTATEIPVSRGAAAREKWFAELASVQDRLKAASTSVTASTWSVYCNNCNLPIPDEHYHCSTCDDGDYDLCPACVNSGVLCGGERHWMIKRFVKDGKVINSTTETIAPRNPVTEVKPVREPETSLIDGSKAIDEKSAYEASRRTCNSCIGEFTEENFVTCTTCDDFDLCLLCHVANQHGHNPKHAFVPAVNSMNLDARAKTLLGPGRNTSHNAICDGCDKYIYGVRHKCLDCPDWDYCSECIVNATFIHPRHRFAPLYEPISEIHLQNYFMKTCHQGIYCDGPLCSRKSNNIVGDRYKCAVCHDVDFCSNCEASPSNLHNKTHPLIKFKTPVRNVNVTTMGEHANGAPMPVMGDRRRPSSRSTSTTTTPSANAATQVQTVADLKPTEPAKAEELETKVQEPVEAAAPVDDELVAHFVRDSVPDGTVLPPNCVFEQTWKLKNGGNIPWPAGCSVKFVGGDNMCATDPEHPASIHELVSATESTTAYTEIAPGQSFGFTVLMRTPARPGKVISYWRLTGPKGNKFGHRLWCDVTVEDNKPVEKEEKEDKQEELKEEEKPVEKSQMIFPTLEKESPASSIHNNTSAMPEMAIEAKDEGFEDVEDFDDDETEDGFLTDEEYDILDASDEEYLAEQEKAAKK